MISSFSRVRGFAARVRLFDCLTPLEICPKVAMKPRTPIERMATAIMTSISVAPDRDFAGCKASDLMR